MIDGLSSCPSEAGIVVRDPTTRAHWRLVWLALFGDRNTDPPEVVQPGASVDGSRVATELINVTLHLQHGSAETAVHMRSLAVVQAGKELAADRSRAGTARQRNTSNPFPAVAEHRVAVADRGAADVGLGRAVADRAVELVGNGAVVGEGHADVRLACAGGAAMLVGAARIVAALLKVRVRGVGVQRGRVRRQRGIRAKVGFVEAGIGANVSGRWRVAPAASNDHEKQHDSQVPAHLTRLCASRSTGKRGRLL